MDFGTVFVLALFAVFFLSCQVPVHAERLRFCVVKGLHTSKKIRRTCPKLIVPGSQVECVIENDRFNCLRRLADGNSDFTVLEAEDLVAASTFNEYNILVTNELRSFLNETKSYGMVAIARKSISSLTDLKGKRYCHPGYETTDDWTQAFSSYFESRLIPNECDLNKTLVENRISSASNFFEAACIAGAWTPDARIDNNLKLKYRNLCALCDNPAGCYSGDKYYGRIGALLCLTDNVGDVAWVRLENAISHFKMQKVDRKNFNYLCPDGTVRPLDWKNPCIWISRPWAVIAARSEVAELVSQLMETLDSRRDPWQSALMRLMENYHVSPINTDNLETPEDFLQRFPGFMGANNRAGCQPSRRVQWCTASNLEDQKCRWLRQAAFVYGIEPSISCIQESTRMSCLEAVHNGRADIFVTRPEEELAARKKGLKSILHVFTNQRGDLSKVAALVKRNSHFNFLRDLKGRKACFTEFESIGWNAFASIMRNVSGNSWSCSDVTAIGNFFKESCVPGLDKRNDMVPPNLKSLCKPGDAGDEASTLDCVVSGRADVAFVNLNVLANNTGNSSKSSDPNNFRIEDFKSLCTVESESADTCFLTWLTLGSVMVRENIEKVRHDDIYSMLLEMDLLFGQSFQGQTPLFSMYGSFDGNRDIIFPERTQHLQSDIGHLRLPRSYDEIVEDLVSKVPCSNANQCNIHIITVMTYLLGLVCLNQLI